MIVNAWGVVLTRRNWREADRLATLYTENLGKVAVRFAGVNKPGRKMKALSEPMVWAEYRLYLSPRSEIAKGIGGKLISSFPAIRADLDRTLSALCCCEMMATLTPMRAPNPEKYQLISSVLDALERAPSPWIVTAFGLRLLELSGLGLKEAGAPVVLTGLWESLHEDEFASLGSLPYDAELDRHFRERVSRVIEDQTGKPLKSLAVASKLAPLQEAKA